jgi:hypothetical protein
MVTILACPDPDCRAPATISARWTWPSTDDPVEHVQTYCLNGHCYTPTSARGRCFLATRHRLPRSLDR